MLLGNAVGENKSCIWSWQRKKRKDKSLVIDDKPDSTVSHKQSQKAMDSKLICLMILSKKGRSEY